MGILLKISIFQSKGKIIRIFHEFVEGIDKSFVVWHYSHSELCKTVSSETDYFLKLMMGFFLAYFLQTKPALK